METGASCCDIHSRWFSPGVQPSDACVVIAEREGSRAAGEPGGIWPNATQSVEQKTIAASRKAGLSVTAYSPIARGKVKSDAVLSRIGKAHGKTAAQICLRYLVQQDIVVIPKTSRSERLKENATIFDFKLTAAEMKDIAALASPHGNIVS